MGCNIATINNVFIVSIQRVGSNYIEVLLNNNIRDYAFRSIVVGFEDIDNKKVTKYWSKHTIPRSPFRLPIPHKEVLLITKNPYTWVESIVKRNEVRDMMGVEAEGRSGIWSNYIEDYQIYEADVNDENKLTDKLSIEGLAEVYRDFNEVWLSGEHTDIPVKQIKYEDFISEVKCKDKLDELEYELKGNLKFPNKAVPKSPNFTLEDLTYFKNQKPLLLSTEEINTINDVMGRGLIESFGYEYITDIT